MSSIIIDYKVVLASASDVASEREIVHSVVNKLKEEFKDEGLTLTLHRWEDDAEPSFHPKGPQGLIDEVLKIDQSDVFIGIFHKKVGTPVFDSESGTQHELKQAIESWNLKKTPDIKLYFKKALTSIDEMEDKEIEDFKKIRDFKKGLYQYGVIKEFASEDEFEDQIEKHLKNFLKKKSSSSDSIIIDTEFAKTEEVNELKKIIEVFRQEEQQIDFKSSREQIERVENLKNKIYNEIFQSIEEKKLHLPNIYNQIPKVTFDRLIMGHPLDNSLINDLNNLRYDTVKYKWYDRSLVVSGLTLSLLTNNSFDTKKCHILIDFILDHEENVWQKALVGLILSLIKNQNKIGRFSDLISRLKTLQNNSSVQNGILLIEVLLRERLFLNSVFSKNVYEFDFFKKDLANCFLPFYENNQLLVSALEKADYDFDADSFTNILLNAPLPSAYKYAICLSENFGVKNNEKDKKPTNRELNMFVKRLKIADFYKPYQIIIAEYYQFFKNFPQYAIADFFSKKVFIGKSKLKSIILSKVHELKLSAKAHIEEKEYGSAIVKLENLLSIEKNDLDGLWLISTTCFATYKYDKALEYFLLYDSLEKNDNVSMNIGICYRIKNDRDKELEYLKAAEELNPKNINVIIELAKFYTNINQVNLAEDYFKKGLLLQPENERLNSEYTKFKYSYYKDFEYAGEYYSRKAINSRNAKLLEAYAGFLHREKSYEAADKFYRLSLNIKNDHDVRSNYAEFLLDSNLNKTEGENTLKKLIKAHPNSPIVVYNYLLLVGKFKRDKEEFNRIKAHILNNLNQFPYILVTLSNIQLDLFGISEEATEICKRALELDPYYYPACSVVAFHYLLQDNLVECELHYKRAFDLDPYGVTSMLNLSAILFINNLYDEACYYLDLCSKSVRENDEETMLDMYFLTYMHIHDKDQLLNAERKMKELIDKGVRTDSYHDHNIRKAITDSHFDVESLEKYALLIKK